MGLGDRFRGDLKWVVVAMHEELLLGEIGKIVNWSFHCLFVWMEAEEEEKIRETIDVNERESNCCHDREREP